LEYNQLSKKLYYAQNREDIILQAFFPDKITGFYVDIGAYDPETDSVTKLFYDKGWSGINIEPQPDRHKLFNTKRKRDINLQLGVSNANTTLKLRSYKNQGLSTFSDDIKNRYVKQSRDSQYEFTYSEAGTVEYKDFEVQVKTLKSIFTEHKAVNIDFMKVDVEGLEYEVLEGNDWDRFRPKVLCIEADNIVRDWRGLLTKSGYQVVFNDGLNEYFIDKTVKPPIGFNYVNHVLLKLDGGLRKEHFDVFEKQVSQLEGSILELEQRLKEQSRQLDQRNAQVNSVRWVAGRLKVLLKERLRVKINRLLHRS
jgi:FkbM family methyltransferase